MFENKSKINVLIWCWGRRGGASNFTYLLLKELMSHEKLNLHISISRQSELFDKINAFNLNNFNIDTYVDKKTALKSLLRISALRSKFSEYLQKNKIDIVLCPFSHLWNVVFVDLIKKNNAKYILTLHDAKAHPGENYGIRNYLLKRESSYADAVITLTEHVKKQLIEMHPGLKNLVWVIPHGVLDYTQSPHSPRTLQEREKFKILFFGRILPYKGLDLLLEAFALIEKQIPDAELHIVGGGELLPYQDKLKNLTNIVIENRWITESEIHLFFEKADLVVLPYIEASQSGVIPVAAAFGIPCVVTPVGGLNEQIKHEETGLVTANISAEAIVQSILQLWNDKHLYEKCSQNLLAYTQKEISWQAITNKIVDVIHQVKSQSLCVE